MDAANQALKAALEAIRQEARRALEQVAIPGDERAMRWKCKVCRYIKHFTKPVPLKAAGRCPRCKSTEFTPICL
jgi:predicted Zn-ribbon and HTH transcriptional regulator